MRKAMGTFIGLLASILIITGTVTSAEAQTAGPIGEVTATVLDTYLVLDNVERVIGGTPRGTMIKMPFTVTNNGTESKLVHFQSGSANPDIWVSLPGEQIVGTGDTKALVMHLILKHEAPLGAFDVMVKAYTLDASVEGHITGSVWNSEITIDPALLELGDVYRGSKHPFQFEVKNTDTIPHLVTFLNEYNSAAASLYFPDGYEFDMTAGESRMIDAELLVAHDAELGDITVKIRPYQTWDWTAPP